MCVPCWHRPARDCIYYTTDGDEYCGVLNAAENCVLDGNAGWVCA